MSGHNKWSKIKHKKAITDAKKGKVFSKLAVQITLAARDGGGDPTANPTLRMLMQKAKEVSMPLVNVERAVEKGAGTGANATVLENVVYEGFAPAHVAIIVECLTDNKNRAVSELRTIFNENGGVLGDSGSVSWNFTKKGYISLRPAKYVEAKKFGAEKEVLELDKEMVTLEIMEIDGILDIQEETDDGITRFDIYTVPTKLGAVRDALFAKDLIVEEVELAYVPNNIKTDLTEEQEDRVSNFIDVVEEYQDVVNVWTDLG